MRAWKLGFCLPLALCVPALAVAADDESPWSWSAEASVVHDSNLSRASFERDRVEDVSGLVSASLALNREFGMMAAGTLEGFLEHESFAEIDSLDRASIGARATWRWQRTLGFTAPFYQVSATIQDDDLDGAQRDATVYSLQAFATRRLTDVITASVGVEGRERDADSRVFDMGEARAFANIDYAIGKAWAVYGTYSYVDGDTVSSAQQVFCNGSPAADIFPLLAAAEAVEPDQALDDALCGTWLAYRLPATTQLLSVGVNRGFGHSLALDLNVTQVQSVAEDDIDYQRTQVRASLLGRF